MVKLYLVRHATPVDESVDPKRPLSEQGRKEAASSAAKLSDIKPVMIFHSGKARAKETAEAFADITGGHLEQANGLKPNDAPAVWADRVGAVTEDIMLVGHLPFMARLASQLVKGNQDEQLIDFSPATVACLSQSANGWIVEEVITP